MHWSWWLDISGDILNAFWIQYNMLSACIKNQKWISKALFELFYLQIKVCLA